MLAHGLLICAAIMLPILQWRHNGRDRVSNHQPHDRLLNRLFRRRSKKTSKLCVTGLCADNSLVNSELPAQMTCNAENVSIWWRHHEKVSDCDTLETWYTASVIFCATRPWRNKTSCQFKYIGKGAFYPMSCWIVLKHNLQKINWKRHLPCVPNPVYIP